ncbi:MAG: GGDEF domain-containing protein [Alphaproteobacteria bacterium]|nr:MAG: GGDEF domain-containing protein [Alphaproteobacteria bacterium]
MAIEPRPQEQAETESQTRNVDRSRAVTAKTLEKIDELVLRSTPQFYELWYRYFDGDPEILKAISAHQGPLDEITCQKFYNQYLSSLAHDAALHKASNAVEKSITTVGETIEAARVVTSEFGTAMGMASAKAKAAKSIEEVRDTLSAIIVSTEKMAAQNQALESKLAAMTAQITEIKQHLETARQEATTDSVTGIANRKTFDQRLGVDIEEATTAHTPLVLLMLDIDHFKKFNEKLGSETADQVLRLVARTLLGNVKGRDVAARYGIDEFAILLPGTSLKSGIQVAEILRHAIESKEITDKASNQKLGSITLSIGVAKYREGEDIMAFIDRAEGALAEAKKGGRNRVRVAVENKASPRATE